MTTAQQFDLVIVGGGLAGSTAALAIHKHLPTCRIAIVEANPPQTQSHPSFDDRSIALAAHSVSYLQALGLFNPNSDYAAPIHDVAVSDRGHFGKTWLSADEYQVEALGVVVEVAPFGAYLHQQLSTAQMTLFCPDNVTEVVQSAAQVSLTLASGTKLEAKLLVIADGAQSPTRDKVGISFERKAYQQGALIANVAVQGGHQFNAFERFTEHGPMALLPMSKGRYSLVWCMPEAQLEHYRTLSEVEFLAALQQAFGYRAGVFTQVGQRASYPLVLGRVSSLVAHRVVVVGNAAHAIHPIAGQGFNLGLRDIEALAQLLQQQPPHEWGSYAFTKAYREAREQDISTVMTLTDALVRVFSNRSRLLALGRSLGLTAMALLPALKAPLAKQLMGQVSSK
ncbi:2-octaprenyl-6-methoxyphenyl hydroxylase [Pseudoalteromonas fenneropenaei]|uniref:2-octaprenyl-6-methoxyphenyl hydroxylase n=1 Tax=Pseudoalteromonas fenneropenaei TaxID=1737459 RepID=A0ABV7CEK4_9GAMM